jgi:hypothetical protein
VLRLRSALREFFPAALGAFPDLDAPDTLELLACAPGPDQAAQLPEAKIIAALRWANRRDLSAKAARIRGILRAPALRQTAVVASAYATIVVSQTRLIGALNSEIGELGEVVAAHFGQHPDAEIYASQPGLGVILAARVLAALRARPEAEGTNLWVQAEVLGEFPGLSAGGPVGAAPGYRAHCRVRLVKRSCCPG